MLKREKPKQLCHSYFIQFDFYISIEPMALMGSDQRYFKEIYYDKESKSSDHQAAVE